jgi:hypothetical protein
VAKGGGVGDGVREGVRVGVSKDVVGVTDREETVLVPLRGVLVATAGVAMGEVGDALAASPARATSLSGGSEVVAAGSIE